MFHRLALLATLIAAPVVLRGQQVAYSTYPVAGEFVVNGQFCCYGDERASYFRYDGQTAKLDALRLDAVMFYSGFLQVSFLQVKSPANFSEYTVLETWTGRGFGYDTPLTFLSGARLQSGEVFGVHVKVMPGNDPDPQSIASAAVWSENMDRRPNVGVQPDVFASSYVYEVRTVVDEPNGAVLLIVGGVVFSAVRRRRSH